MPWYKLSADHGPGHQSSIVEYKYLLAPIQKKYLREVLEDWEYHRGLDNPISKIVRITRLPKDQLEHELITAIGKLRYWREVEQSLLEMNSRPPRRKRK